MDTVTVATVAHYASDCTKSFKEKMKKLLKSCTDEENG